MTTKIVMKEVIENMSRYHQIEVLRVLQSHPNVKLSENKNGTFVNLTEQPPEVLAALEHYMKYVAAQQNELNTVEVEKLRIEQTFFTAP